MIGLGKPFLKKSDNKKSKIKNLKNQCQIGATEQKTNSEKWKIGSKKITRPRMNCGWNGKTYLRKPDQKIEKP